MLQQSSQEDNLATGLFSSSRLTAEPLLAHPLLFWNWLVSSADRLLKAASQEGRRKVSADGFPSSALPRIPQRNTRYEIMRIEARRRI
jgi:hypothetical protein